MFYFFWAVDAANRFDFDDFNQFPNTPLWDRPKFKEAADDNWNVAIQGF